MVMGWIKETLTDSGVSSKRITAFVFVVMSVLVHITIFYISIVKIDSLAIIRKETETVALLKTILNYLIYLFFLDSIVILLLFAIITNQDVTKWATLVRLGKIEPETKPTE